MRKILVLAAAITVMATVPVAAQSTAFGIGAFAGVSLPMGDYASTDGADAGNAELGFTGGIDLFYPLAMAGGLSWLTSVSVTAHSVDSDAANLSGGYFYIPLMTGLRADFPVGPLGLFATGQLGLVLNWGPERSGLVGDADSSMGTHFGFALGGGVQVTRNFYVGAKYFPLGTVGLEYGDAGEIDQSVSYLDIALGFGVR